jgi:transposase
MLRMDQVHVIRHKVLVEGLSIRSVARQMCVSRNTVRKYLKVSAPIREEKAARVRPVMEKVALRIDELLEEWKRRTTKKQRITGSRIHRQLIEDGYHVGITTVREYWREKKRQEAEVYVPFLGRPNECAQVDFFEVTVEESGVMRKGWKFLMRLIYSGKDFVWLYDRCDQLSFLDAHVKAFGYFGGVCQRIIYDNLGAAVKKRLKLDRELTERFLALSSHYLFEPCFTRPGEGHDKGGVESRGKGIRLQHLTPVPRGEDLEEMSQGVLEETERMYNRGIDREGKNGGERFAEEQPLLKELPNRPFEARKTVLTTVSKHSLVRIDGSDYSVPSRWARLEVTAHVGVRDIHFSCFGEQVSAPRRRKRGREIKYRHYLKELARKPQAVRQVAPQLVKELGEPYEKLWGMLSERYGERDASRVMAKVLGSVVDHGEQPVAEALADALEKGRSDLLALAGRLHPKQAPLYTPVPPALELHTVESARAADYDALLGVSP